MTRPLLFPKSRHLRRSRDFDRVYDLQQRAGDARLLVFAAPNPESEQTRIGFSISKKHGNSVRRHRIRRLLREAYRLSQFDVPEGLDLILIPRPGSDATLDDYRQSLVRLSRKLHKRLAGESP